MNSLTDKASGFSVRYLFEIGFGITFILYMLFLQFLLTYQKSIDLSVFLPVGLLFVAVSTLTRDTFVINWTLAIATGFVIGWVIRKLWKQGTIGQVILIALVTINCLGIYYWFFMNAD